MQCWLLCIWWYLYRSVQQTLCKDFFAIVYQFNLACECDAQGSSNPDVTGCTVTGQCLCHEGYAGTKCNVCSEGYVRQEEGGECLQIEQTEQCPDGWKAIGGKCYMASTEKATWEEANRTCSSLGGKLVEPLNSEEDSGVALFMEERYASQRYWIGLSDQVEESK